MNNYTKAQENQEIGDTRLAIVSSGNKTPIALGFHK